MLIATGVQVKGSVLSGSRIHKFALEDAMNVRRRRGPKRTKHELIVGPRLFDRDCLSGIA